MATVGMCSGLNSAGGTILGALALVLALAAGLDWGFGRYELAVGAIVDMDDDAVLKGERPAPMKPLAIYRRIGWSGYRFPWHTMDLPKSSPFHPDRG